MTTFFLGGDRGPAALSGAAMEAWQQATGRTGGGEQTPLPMAAHGDEWAKTVGNACEWL